jgi:hypothetical protein
MFNHINKVAARMIEFFSKVVKFKADTMRYLDGVLTPSNLCKCSISQTKLFVRTVNIFCQSGQI